MSQGDDEEMSQERFMLQRPFEEENESALMVIYEFDDALSDEQLRDMAEDIVSILQDKDIVIGSVGVDKKHDGIIIVNLQRSNVGYSEINDLRSAGMQFNGYRDTVITTVPASQILRFSR